MIQFAWHSCSEEKLNFAVLDSVTFEILSEKNYAFSEEILDIALEQNADGTVFVAVSQSLSGVLVYSFNGDALHFHQVTLF